MNRLPDELLCNIFSPGLLILSAPACVCRKWRRIMRAERERMRMKILALEDLPLRVLFVLLEGYAAKAWVLETGPPRGYTYLKRDYVFTLSDMKKILVTFFSDQGYCLVTFAPTPTSEEKTNSLGHNILALVDPFHQIFGNNKRHWCITLARIVVANRVLAKPENKRFFWRCVKAGFPGGLIEL